MLETISIVINEVLKSVNQSINVTKANAKWEYLFKHLREDKNVDNVTLILHTEARWLYKGICLKRIMELFDVLSDF